MMLKAFLTAVVACAATWASAGTCGDWTHALDEFPARVGETDDTARLQRAIDATPEGVLYVPEGTYRVSKTIELNMCSLRMHKNALIRAVAEMPFVLLIQPWYKNGAKPTHDRGPELNLFICGGRIDGNGLASCVSLDGFVHYTVRDMTFLNGRKYGLRVSPSGGVELNAFNLYFRCTKRGLAGNTAVYTTGGDSHYTDCWAVDYTVGFHTGKGGSNRLTRCHVWGGGIPPVAPGRPPEMLENSVNFWVDGSGSTILRDCYADTGKIGFAIHGWDTRLLGCSYFSNPAFKLDGITAIKHTFGRLLVSEGEIVKNCKNFKVYDGVGTVEWSNMIYAGFSDGDDCPGGLKFNRKSATDEKALKLAD